MGDDFQCGVWSFAILRLFVAYASSTSEAGFDTVVESHDVLRPLNGLRGDERSAAVAANDSFIVSLRDARGAVGGGANGLAAFPRRSAH